MTVQADDVRRLLDSADAGAALVAIEGRVEVVTSAQLDSDTYRGALQLATREDVAQRVGSDASERELDEQAQELDTALRNLGA
jgi:hypothetical protein